MAVRYVRYEGEFLSRNGIAWKVQIWRTNGSYAVEELKFPADEPVVIEWDTKAKEEVICGSSCTVRVVSPSDRKYIDLYTVTPGEIGVAIFRKGRNNASYSLYWMGTLDAEQYEEPYERAYGYDVMLTFQDFGAWNRLKYNLEGLQVMSDVLADALLRVGLISETETSNKVDFSTFVSSYHINESSSAGGENTENIDNGVYDNTNFPVVTGGNDHKLDISEHTIHILNPDTGGGSPATDAATAIKATIDTMAVQSSAFYDDEGEGMTLADVVTAMFLPLGLKIVQRNGKIWVYDINALTEVGTGSPYSLYDDPTPGLPRLIQWTGDSQTLSTDRVYNKIKLTLDPKAKGRVVDPKVEIKGIDELVVNVNGTITDAEPWQNTYYSNYRKNGSAPYDPSDLQFTIFYNIPSAWGVSRGISIANNGFFKIVSLLGGTDAEGIVGKIVAGNAPMADASHVSATGTLPLHNAVQLRTERVYIPPIRSVSAGERRWMLRLQLEMLVDVRYNPFTEAGEYNEGENYDNAKNGWNYVHIPCNVRLYTEKVGGTCKLHYDNRSIARRAGNYDGGENSLIYMGGNIGQWLPGAESEDAGEAGCWLSWYANEEDSKERDKSTGIGGWKKNRHQIGNRNGRLAADLLNLPDGQYMPYPPAGGWLEISVWNGIITMDTGGLQNAIASLWGAPEFLNNWNNSSAMRWILYKTPVVDVVSGSVKHETFDMDDVEISGTAMAGAEEDLELDLTVGTMDRDIPSARAQIYRMGTGLRLRKLTRNGETDSPEKLLLRTLRAQYGSRMTILSGEAAIQADEPHLWTDSNRSGEKMLMLGEVQNLIENTTDVELCDVVSDASAGSNVPATVWFSVTYDLEKVVVVGSMPSRLHIASLLELELAADEGYRISNVVVRMDGEEVDNAWDDETGILTVGVVMGDIEITAEAEEMPYDAQVEYLQGDGVAYIDTGVKVASTIRFVADVHINAETDKSYSLFGGRTASQENAVYVGILTQLQA